ncbi:MAG TPA: hypothetical protein VF481_02705 [Novosphingobium sp.]
MKKFAALAAVATLAIAAPAFAAESSQSVRAATDAAAGSVAVNAGKMLYTANGSRVAAIYRVTAEGNPQVILNGKLVTVPASTLSDVNGKVTTSLSKAELGRAQ